MRNNEETASESGENASVCMSVNKTAREALNEISLISLTIGRHFKRGHLKHA